MKTLLEAIEGYVTISIAHAFVRSDQTERINQLSTMQIKALADLSDICYEIENKLKELENDRHYHDR